ncbi:transglutaminase domain-containing protein [Tenacibaculum sediminilitoris]|uniref:transglutaminase domain-containing protein n=1 Tax=Tenacibaculum sediminilitoris TaxID=1820334 RepID=UPI0038B5C93C
MKVWDALLDNNRKEALNLVNQLDAEKDIEILMLKKLVESENGMMQSDSNFLNEVTTYKNYENYMFSNWTMTYFFSDYLETGFSSETFNLPHLIDASKIQNSTVKNGLYYLQAISKRHQKKWKEYYSLMNKVNAINDWEYCGVFENLNSSGIDMPYPPEEEVSNKVVFDAQSNGDTQWYKSPNEISPYNFFTNHSEYGSGVHYAQTFINSPKSQRVKLKLGKGGLIRLWLNDVLILEGDDKYITELDAYTYEVNLQKGVNRVLVKLATEGSTPYFILRLEDLNEKPLKNYNISFKNRKYTKGSLEKVNAILKPHSIETYFKEKIKDLKNDINLTRFCLFLTYYRNGKTEKAIHLLEEWSKEHPKSSLIKSCLIKCYDAKGDQSTLKKLQNNIKREDPNYYLSSILEYENFDELMRLDIKNYEEKLKKIGNSVDYPFIKTVSEFMILLRRENRQEMRNKLDSLLNDSTLPTSMKPVFAEFYSKLFNDDNATISILEKYNESELNSEVVKYLAYYYKKHNRIEDLVKIYTEVINRFKDDNNFIYDLVQVLHDTDQFKESLPFVEKALINYPNSFLFFKLKGDIHTQIGENDKAISLYKKALTRSPSNKKLRGRINDLENKKRALSEFALKEPYNFIKEGRGKGTVNNYGVNILLDQSNVLSYKRGGGELQETFIYEVTSKNGVEIFKEYNLGLSGDYQIKKAEIIKPNGESVPADRKGSNLVFTGLEVEDVIYIDYEKTYSTYGRFYKDYILSHSFNGYHPVVRSVYRFLTLDKEVNHLVKNGRVEYNKYKKGEYYIHEWKLENAPSIPVSEDYMPAFNDVVTRLSISSISSWNDIAIWYSDIVRKQLRVDKRVEETFKEIFPEGYDQLSENERAKKIYYYITDNLNYSHVSFRQGGYVPQKPSKTIKTKLGDCKDFSSLFLVLAKKAKLDVNMVLILTSDYAKNQLLLPSTDFNHCIVKVKIDGKDQFLELTDKTLPYKSLPMSLREATALEIPYDNSKINIYELFKLNNVSREKTTFKSVTELELNKKESDIELITEVSGHLASYYIDILTNKKGKLLEDEILDEISNRSTNPVKLINIESINYNKEKGDVTYKTKLTSDIKINKVGSLLTFKIPYYLNPYNNSVIQLDKRLYPIDYRKYENTDDYIEKIVISLKDNQEFVDVPEDVNYSFMNHTFSISYKLTKKNELEVGIVAHVTTDLIKPEDYSKFKDYVTKILDTRDVLVSYK